MLPGELLPLHSDYLKSFSAYNQPVDRGLFFSSVRVTTPDLSLGFFFNFTTCRLMPVYSLWCSDPTTTIKDQHQQAAFASYFQMHVITHTINDLVCEDAVKLIWGLAHLKTERKAESYILRLLLIRLVPKKRIGWVGEARQNLYSGSGQQGVKGRPLKFCGHSM